MNTISYEEIRKKIRSCDMLLIGIGQEFQEGKRNRQDQKKALEQLASFVKGLNYFVLSSNKDGLVEEIPWRQDAVAAPMYREDEKAWERYMKWVSYTLNHKLLILELGEGFLNPAVMRWPFERMVMVNQKAELVRVGEVFAQIPEEIKEKGRSLPISAISFIEELCASGDKQDGGKD